MSDNLPATPSPTSASGKKDKPCRTVFWVILGIIVAIIAGVGYYYSPSQVATRGLEERGINVTSITLGDWKKLIDKKIQKGFVI